jgi:hypothetical protein
MRIFALQYPGKFRENAAPRTNGARIVVTGHGYPNHHG